MGNFAENLNLGNRFRPPLVFTVQKYTAPNFQNSKKFFSLRILIF